MGPETAAKSGSMHVKTGESLLAKAEVSLFEPGNSDAGQAGSIDIVPGYSGEGNDGTNMILSGGSTPIFQPTKLVLYSFAEDPIHKMRQIILIILV